MENFQAVCLLLGAAIFLGAAVRSEPSGRRTFTAGLALFYFTMLVLEFDVRPYDVPLLQRLFNGWIRDVWLLLFWLAAGACFLRHARATWESFLDWCRHPAGWLLIIAGSLWVGSAVIDKAVLGSKNLYLEEAVEVGAAWLMLVAAWETWLLPGPSVLPGIGFDRGGAE